MPEAFITEITELKNCGVFNEWPDDKAFGRYNLIYGWNGSGKTTFSRLFRSLEKGAPVPELKKHNGLSVKYKLGDNSAVTGTDYSEWKSLVRVFNSDFVRSNINADTCEAEPVFHLGEEQGAALEQQKTVKTKLDLKIQEYADHVIAASAYTDAHENKMSEKAGNIKTTLSEVNFNKTKLKQTIDTLPSDEKEVRKFILSDAAFQETLKIAINETGKLNAQSIISDALSIEPETLHAAIKEIARREIIKKAIQDLDSNSELKDWVSAGFHLHKGKKTCAFCTSEIPTSRIQDLTDYFNAAYEALEKDINAQKEQIANLIDGIKAITPHSYTLLYPAQQTAYRQAVTSLNSAKKALQDEISALEKTLDTKISTPSKSAEIPSLEALTEKHTAFKEAMKTMNSSVGAHNTDVEKFAENMRDAKAKIIKHYAAEMHATHSVEVTQIKENTDKQEALKNEKDALQKEFNSLEEKLKKHSIAIKRINELLSAFIGRSDIQLEINAKGYTIKRDGEVAEHLSEGEKTAVAFTYFLSKLEEKDFKLADGIVVIDDPISSLDTNALYAAGAFIRRYLEDAKQLFILTHNYTFFREIYGWINAFPDKKKKKTANQKFDAFYMFKCSYTEAGERRSKIHEVDELLRNYDNEYVFHCKMLFDERGKLKYEENANKDTWSKLMLMPNIARKVMETFLLFKFPSVSKGSMIKVYTAAKDYVEDIGQDKLAVLDRLLNRGSHGDDDKMSSVNVFNLDETPKVIEYVLEFIETVDPLHYKELQTVCGVQPTASNDDNKGKIKAA